MRAWLASHKLAAIGGALVAAFVLGALANHYRLRSPFGPDDEAGSVERPLPAEFLYLDNDRVGAYLAQLNGGIAKSERLSETLRREDSAKASGAGFEVGASSQRENFVEREVTPTAAASFFRLYAVLRQQEKLHEVEVDNLDAFTRSFRNLPEGAFVRFESHDLRTPIYANSYLVVRQVGTLKALFPTAGASDFEREQIEAAREEARSYAHQVGENPRIVFALTPPLSEQEKRERKREWDDAKADASATNGEADGESVKPKKGEPPKKRWGIEFLLPVRYRQLTDERSLIKNGGGRFTVVGKMVRVFRRSRDGVVSYVDAPTRETWKKPLGHVPGALLARSSRLCGTPVGSRAARRAKTARKLRACVRKLLRIQTEIPGMGAVILPIAIYK
jgi:hypothetical protein